MDTQLCWLRVAKWTFAGWVIVALWRLHGLTLLDPDEAHYAQLTREMRQAGNWLVPLLDGRPHIDKPVLFHWMQGLAAVVFGETEFAMRLPSVAAALALVWTTRWCGTQLFERLTGDRGALMLATIPLTILLASVGLLDMVFTAFLFGAIACLLVAALRPSTRYASLQYVGYCLLILAVMTKGPVALLLAGLFFVTGCLCGKECRAALLSLRWKSGLTIVVIGSLPWFLWMWVTFGDQFLQQYFLAGNLWYVTQPKHFSDRAFHHTLYITTFLAGFFPWSFVAVGGGVDTFRRWRSSVSERRPEEILLWVWMLVIFVFFSLARFKVDRYVYPAAPACCLLAAKAWLSVSVAGPNFSGAHQTWGTRWAVGLLGVCLAAVGVVTGLFLFELGLDLPRTALLIPVSLTAAGTALAATMIQRHWVTPSLFAGLLLMLLVVYSGVVTIGFSILERVRPTAVVAEGLRPQLTTGDQIGLYRLERWRSSLRYYLGRPVARLEDPDDLKRFLEGASRGYVLLLGDDYEKLRNEGVNLHSLTTRPAVTGTTGQGFRRQKWGTLVVATTEEIR